MSMENNSSGVKDRTMEVGLSNGPSFRGRPMSTMSDNEISSLSPTTGSMSPISSPTPLPPHPLHHYQQIIHITVHKDEKGYGMKVSGDNPVYVQSVKEGGAASKAGLHSGDKIIMVNGENVTHSTHTDVVELIRAADHVTLTVQQRPLLSNSISSPTMTSRPFLHSHSTPSRERVTAPLPVDLEQKRHLESVVMQTCSLMLEKDQRYVEAIRSDLAKCTDPALEAKLTQELERAKKRVITLQNKLGIETAKAHPPNNAHSTSLNRDIEHALTRSTLPTSTALSTVPAFLDSCREDPGPAPPPLPQRNRPSGSSRSPPRPASHPTHTGLPGLSYLDPPPLPPHPILNNINNNQGAESIPGTPHSPTNSHGAQSSLQTHHRAKSSPDPLGHLSNAEASKRLIVSESLSDLSNSKRVKSGIELDSPRVTPPGTPPPPYGGNTSTPNSQGTGDARDESLDVSPGSACLQRLQQQIISMEDDEISDQEVEQLGDHGPFKHLSKLWEHNAHLAVFMNYVLSNWDPTSILFYLLTDLYKEGNAKEMKKWAYEIHSTFLVPGAPLRLNNVDENIAREIDDVLQRESDKEEIIRKVFWKARAKAKEELNDQLADFQEKRTAGLGTLYGPVDSELDESIHDKMREMKIIEEFLGKKFLAALGEVEKEKEPTTSTDMRHTLQSIAVVTVLGKHFGLRGMNSNTSTLFDRCPTFVSKDKSFKARIIGKSRKLTLMGHNFNEHHYYTVTYCNHCQHIIFGVGPQGYQCSHCGLNVHRHCVRIVEENCPGPLVKKERGNTSITKLMDRIREREPRRKPSSLNLMKRQPEEKEESGASLDGEAASGDRPVAGRLADKRPDTVAEERERGSGSDRVPPQSGAAGGGASTPGSGAASGLSGGPGTPGSGQSAQLLRDEDNHHNFSQHHMPKTKSASSSINRSESYKERVSQKRQLRERRKTSDPNLSKSKHVEDKNPSNSRHTVKNLQPDRRSDADLEASALSYNSGSSSNSSLSTRSLDSPSNSLEVVGSVGHTPAGSNASATPHWDSDAEFEPDTHDWIKDVPEETLKSLSEREMKRQEVINELFHTERSHVRNLKVLDMLFFRPMSEGGILPPDQLSLLFANLDKMIEIHSKFNDLCKTRRKESPVVGEVGDILLSLFDGQNAEEFQQEAAKFCARQQIALEALKERRRKDVKLNSFLLDAEGNSMCRRLQLKDILPSGMQRLTKYPLLFNNLAKYTDPDSAEHAIVLRALTRSKEILNHVNHAIRLQDILRRIDRSAFEKVDQEFKNLDVTKHRLIHDGPLIWRNNSLGTRQKLVELHVMLFEEFIILLQRQDDKFVLKCHNSNAAPDRTPQLSPIIKVSAALVRTNAADETALFLFNTTTRNGAMYDLVAPSKEECIAWEYHIRLAAEKYMTDRGHRRSELINLPQVDAADSQQGKTKESEEFAANPTQGASEESAASRPVVGSPSTEVPTIGSPNAGPSSPSTPTKGPEPVTSPSARRRTEPPIRLTTEGSPLIEPSEVTVSQRPVLTAEPVLTPHEKLRRIDESIRQALAEKEQLVADILHIPREDFQTISEMAAQPSHDKEAAELVLAAINQANQLFSMVNDCLRVSEEDTVIATSGTSPRQSRRSACMPTVPTRVLLDVSTSLNSQLTQLLKMMKERDEERERLRRELQRSREQLHVMHEINRRSGSSGPPGSSQPLEKAEETKEEIANQQTDQNLSTSSINEEDDAGLSESMKRLSICEEDGEAANDPASVSPEKAVKDTRQTEHKPESQSGTSGSASAPDPL